jgi:hypothetical protein
MAISELETIVQVAAAAGITGLCGAILSWKFPEILKVVLTFIRDIMRDRKKPPPPPREPKEKAESKRKQTLEGPLDSQI